MPNAVTHVLLALIILSFFRHHIVKKREFPLYLVLIGGLAGLLPDIDILIYWFTSGVFSLVEVHRLFTHNFVIPLVIFFIGLVVMRYKDKIGKIFMVVGFGWFLHVFLDGLLSGTVYPIYPLMSVGWGLNLLPGTIFGGTIFAGIDAILLVGWLVYEYWQHNIKEYT
ncbi:metal-dependent hydrolase [archaeon]|jgi:membrane-bound metal-dependent hydrolase YbcI (DUF457 family)|nr:metal-dependent hydrolase [archaeon]MBT4397215.1 metal-dependent hydrolase [archaeon]MBT4440595.1 metal-dependent hydrolase [archaeon]